MHLYFRLCRIVVLFFLVSMILPASAGIVITGTRVVYPAGEKDVSIKIDNESDKPVLAQVWVDDGDASASPETANVPFTLTPPVSRLNGGKGQTLRLMFTGAELSKDKESLFWLNVLGIPAKSQKAENQIQMAVRSRIKIFYRPEGLVGEASEAGRAVKWKKVKGGFEATNPTPYYVSVAKISDDKAGKNPIAEGGMIAPGGRQFFASIKQPDTIYPSYINDFGGIKPESQAVSH